MTFVWFNVFVKPGSTTSPPTGVSETGVSYGDELASTAVGPLTSSIIVRSYDFESQLPCSLAVFLASVHVLSGLAIFEEIVDVRRDNVHRFIRFVVC